MTTLHTPQPASTPAQAAESWTQPVAAAQPPSWLHSLRRPLAAAALGWLALLALVLWLWMGHVVNAMLDEALRRHAAGIAQVLVQAPGAQTAGAPAAEAAVGVDAGVAEGVVPAQRTGVDADAALVWQVMAADGQLLLRSPQAPTQALATTGAPEPNPANGGAFVLGLPSWRVWSQTLPSGGRLLVAEREGARAHATRRITVTTVLVALSASLPALVWLAWQWRARLQPVAGLGGVLAAYEPLDPQRALPAPTWAEWAPAHAAAAALGARVRRAAQNERAYTDHAQALLTAPLAGLEQQLAAAQREAPSWMHPRLSLARAEAARLGHGVAALQGLFHGGGELHLQPVEVAALLARMPVPGLEVKVLGSRLECADAHLVAAALMGLIDSARRRRARTVTVHVQATQLQLHDDGAHPSAERLSALRQTAAEGAPAYHAGGGGGREGDRDGEGEGEREGGGATLQVAAVSATTLERYAHHRGSDERPAPGRDEVAEDLALALAHRVAKAHGGRLVLPETDTGLLLQIQLPSLAV